MKERFGLKAWKIKELRFISKFQKHDRSFITDDLTTTIGLLRPYLLSFLNFRILPIMELKNKTASGSLFSFSCKSLSRLLQQKEKNLENRIKEYR
jgi:hypothetical protein